MSFLGVPPVTGPRSLPEGGTPVPGRGYPPEKTWEQWKYYGSGWGTPSPARSDGVPPGQEEGVPPLPPPRMGYTWTGYATTVRLLRFPSGGLSCLLFFRSKNFFALKNPILFIAQKEHSCQNKIQIKFKERKYQLVLHFYLAVFCIDFVVVK